MKKNTIGIYSLIQIIFLLFTLSSCSNTATPTKMEKKGSFAFKIEEMQYKIYECYKGSRIKNSLIIYFNISRRAQITNIATIPASTIPQKQCLSLILLSMKFDQNLVKKKMKVRAQVDFDTLEIKSLF